MSERPSSSWGRSDEINGVRAEEDDALGGRPRAARDESLTCCPLSNVKAPGFRTGS